MYHAGNPMVQVTFRLTKEDRERIKELAAQAGMGVSDWLREAVERALEREESK